MLLDDREDGGGRADDAEDHVEGDEELVELALADHIAGVVAVAEDDADDGDDIEDASDGEEGVEPVLVVAAAVIILPGFGPGMGKVDDEDELDNDEHEASYHAEVHPCGPEAAVRDEKGSDAAGDDDEILEAPEPVLDAGSRVSGVSDTHHDEGHEDEEEGDDKADPIDGEVPDGIFTLDALGEILDPNVVAHFLTRERVSFSGIFLSNTVRKGVIGHIATK